MKRKDLKSEFNAQMKKCEPLTPADSSIFRLLVAVAGNVNNLNLDDLRTLTALAVKHYHQSIGTYTLYQKTEAEYLSNKPHAFTPAITGTTEPPAIYPEIGEPLW